MKFLYNIFLLLVVCNLLHAAEVEQQQLAKHDYKVRVLLERRDIFSDDDAWHISSEKGMELTDPCDAAKKIAVQAPTLDVRVWDNALYLNNQKFLRQQVTITSDKGPLLIDGKKYPGTLLIVRVGQGALLINTVDLEEYVASVLKSESWPGWPLEVNKALAISCRSFAVSRIIEARKKKRIFDIRSTNADQTYKGMHSNSAIHVPLK